MEWLNHLYLGCTLVGGGLVAMSFFTDADHDADMDLDVDMDVDMDLDVDADSDVDLSGGGGVSAADALWLPVLSLRFWIFFTAFFGLMGGVLTLVGGLSQMTVLGIALGTGFFTGYTTSRLIQMLRSEKVHSNVDPLTDYVGAKGEVLLRIDDKGPGQVRLNVKGIDVDLPAITEGATHLDRGAKVKVTRYAEGTLLVVPQEAA